MDLKLHNGQRVKILSSKLNEKQWIPGSIDYETDTKLLIRYDNNWAKYMKHTHEWIKNKSNLIQNLSQKSIKCKDIKHNIQSVFNCTIKPIYYNSGKPNDKDYLIVNREKAIYFYDISNNHCEFITNYPLKCKPISQILDKKTNSLFIITDKQLLLNLNLTTKQWKIITTLQKSKDHSKNTDNLEKKYDMDLVIISDTLHIIQSTKQFECTCHCIAKHGHSFTKYIRLKLNHNNNIHLYEEILSNNFSENTSIFYVKSLQQLFVFGEEQIYYSDVHSHYQDFTQKKNKWKVLPFKLPEKYYAIMAYDHFVIIIDRYSGDIYWIDLLYKEFNISDKLFPKAMYINNGYNVKCGDNMIHYITEYEHCVWSLDGIIPNEIQDKYRENRYNLLIVGFMKSEEEIYNLNVPIYLKKIVVEYYQSCFEC